MARDNIPEYSATASANTVVADVNIDEGCPPSGINNAIREVMAALKDVDTGATTLTSPAFTSSTSATIKTATVKHTNDTASMTIAANGAVTFSQVPSLPDNTVETADVQDNAITLAKMAGLTRGSIIYGNANGDPTALPVGTGTLTGDGTDISWGTAQTVGPDQVVWPSDFASPTNTYTSSGTWSKGSLADTAYVWVYLVGGGGGGGYGSNGYSVGGAGGSALLLYGQAQWFNGGAYVIGAGGSSGASQTNSTPTTFTLSSSNSSTVFTTGTDGGSTQGQAQVGIFKQIEDKTSPITIGGQVLAARLTATSTFILPDTVPTIPNQGGGEKLYNGAVYPNQGGYSSPPANSVFAGGGGEGAYAGNGSTRGGSLYGGRGAAYASGIAGATPGGGGASGTSSSNNSDGGAGNVRVYHV